jgi:hypothetical protein
MEAWSVEKLNALERDLETTTDDFDDSGLEGRRLSGVLAYWLVRLRECRITRRDDATITR